jgi:hypothetical protein
MPLVIDDALNILSKIKNGFGNTQKTIFNATSQRIERLVENVSEEEICSLKNGQRYHCDKGAPN